MWKEKLFRLHKDEEGLGTLEILLIVAVLVAIAIAFRKWIIEFVNNLFADVNETDLQNRQDIDIGEPPGGDSGEEQENP